MKTVKHILQSKSAAIFAVSRDTSVLEALQIMMEKNISALLIIEDEKLLGIFTERDYARKVILHGKSSKDTTIQEIMTSSPCTISLSDSIESCMVLMTENHFRHLPVVEDEKVIGMLSIGDLVKFIIEDQKQTIDHLQSYIHS
ncbi:MAG TPA: CBS domain-containing protein [Sphingobacterium bovisgrunnientis]|jgi:CBS domain-containing protein|uniref:CBS domain-containing protein n=1 Tax=Sphingobacterium bovisgrunnientis TaxID=1874697 RepID=UPI00135B0C1A|nr:CBS domain-containing protein [Sphingobacterium bovisgrunnientis]HLS38144.1 CBS domain-containing protein [Sphingobacterium bovisgrunnientis]